MLLLLLQYWYAYSVSPAFLLVIKDNVSMYTGTVIFYLYNLLTLSRLFLFQSSNDQPFHSTLILQTLKFFHLFRQLIHLCLELFILSFQGFDIDILGSPHISLDVVNGMQRPFWFFVQAHQYLGECINDSRLFQIFAKFVLFNIIVIIIIVLKVD